jgi:hypothetical protein
MTAPDSATPTDRPVRVTWLDSAGNNSWRSLASALDEFGDESQLRCRSVGYLIGESDAGVMLAQSLGHQGGDNVADTLFIPRPAILEVEALT